MQYFVIEKFCENACKLTFIGESFDRAADHVKRLNQDGNKRFYIIAGSHMQNIFFSGCSQKQINEYWDTYSKRDGNNGPRFLYMPLHSDFEEYISDLSTLFMPTTVNK